MARDRWYASLSAKADDPVFPGAGDGTQLRGMLDFRFCGNDLIKDRP
jgi:hypothetical protein